MMRKWIPMFVCIVVLFCGCADRRTETPAADPSTESVSESISNTESSEEEPGEIQPPSREEIEEMLKSMTEEDLKSGEVISASIGAIGNWIKWIEFLESVEKGENASVIIVTFTVEGDPIVNYLEYSKTEDEYYLAVDNSRDRFGVPLFAEYTRKYLSVIDIRYETKEGEWTTASPREWHVVIDDRKYNTKEEYTAEMKNEQPTMVFIWAYPSIEG
ncbi:MAG: DUF4362 domain-containing protein [Oscillospiraceae bacterium]|nr:DUF4362 domain-containing protein [Oscillospiraceae bacterium]